MRRPIAALGLFIMATLATIATLTGNLLAAFLWTFATGGQARVLYGMMLQRPARRRRR